MSWTLQIASLFGIPDRVHMVVILLCSHLLLIVMPWWIQRRLKWHRMVRFCFLFFNNAWHCSRWSIHQHIICVCVCQIWRTPVFFCVYTVMNNSTFGMCGCMWNLKNVKVNLCRRDCVSVCVGVYMRLGVGLRARKIGQAIEWKRDNPRLTWNSWAYRMTFAVSTHSGCKHSQESTVIHCEFSVASLAISTRWQASIKPFFL